MTARQVHAVIAAGLENVSLVDRWQEEPERLREQGIDPAAIDLTALRKFAGLTVKVRHNQLREDLPLTFRLMNVAGLEIEVFSAYAAFRAPHGFAATTGQRMLDFMAFLEAWLDCKRREHAMLWDLIRHEHALARLTKEVASTATDADRRGPSARSLPRVSGAIVLHEMQCDPRQVAAALELSRPALDGVAFGSRNVCYWRPGSAAEVHIIELDDFGFCALSLVDGVRSVADLSEAMVGKRRPRPVFLRLLGQLGAAGILRFDRR
jgi:hypothetical protein